MNLPSPHLPSLDNVQGGASSISVASQCNWKTQIYWKTDIFCISWIDCSRTCNHRKKQLLIHNCTTNAAQLPILTLIHIEPISHSPMPNSNLYNTTARLPDPANTSPKRQSQWCPVQRRGFKLSSKIIIIKLQSWNLSLQTNGTCDKILDRKTFPN